MARMTTITLGVVLMASGLALAHDQQAHGRPAAHGTVASVGGDQLTLTTGEGPVSVTLTDTTKIERAGEAVGRGALASGVAVTVFGTKVPQQGLVAREVVLDGGGLETTPHDGHPSGH